MLEGSIVNYANEPFSISGDQQTTSNEVTISVRATFKYTNKEQAEWSKTFSGSDDYDTNENPIEGENTAAENALDQIANDMFNDAVSGW